MEELNNSVEKDFFKEIMQKSKLKMPFSDFEDTIMFKIEERKIEVNTFNERKSSIIGFVVGTIFGIIISFVLLYLKKPILGMEPKTIALLFQITFVTLLFSQMKRFITLFNSVQSKINKK